MSTVSGIGAAFDLMFRLGGWKYAITFAFLYWMAAGNEVNIMCTAIPDEFVLAAVIALCIAAIVGGLIMASFNWAKHIGETGVRKKLAVKHVATAAVGVVLAGGCGYVFAPVAVATTYGEFAGKFEWAVITFFVTFILALVFVYFIQGGFSAIKKIGEAAVEGVDVITDAGDKIFTSIQEFQAWYQGLSKKQKAAYDEKLAEEAKAKAAAEEFAKAHPELVKPAEEPPKE